MIVNIGSLSHFNNAEGHAGWELGDGCFNPYRGTTGVNEQRFYKTGGLQQMRAYTANSALGGRQRQSNAGTATAAGNALIKVEDRQMNTMNHTLNGFYHNHQDPKPIQKDGTVVL